MSSIGRITAKPLTSGPVSPGLAALSGGYKYNKDPDWYPNHPRYREPAASEATLRGVMVRVKHREERVRQFTAHREEGKDVREAGRLVGVDRKTAHRYEDERCAALARKTGETP